MFTDISNAGSHSTVEKMYITPIYGTKKLTIYESSPLIFYKRIFYLMTMIDRQSILVNVALNKYQYE